MNVAEALRTLSSRLIIGWLEYVALPELHIPLMTAKTDTGARTASLHASNIEGYSEAGAPFVRFLPPQQWVLPEMQGQALCLPVVDKRSVRNTGGLSQTRYVVMTTLRIAHLDLEIEVNLTDRTPMQYDMLLGRTTLCERFLIQPCITYAAGKPHA